MANLAQRLDVSLQPLFGGPIKYIADSNAIMDWLLSEACDVYSSEPALLKQLAAQDELPNVVFVISRIDGVPNHATWKEVFGKSRLMVVPLLAFSPLFEAASYTMEKIAESDFVGGAALNHEWLQRVSRVEEPFHLRGEGTDFTCEFDHEVNLLAPKIEGSLEPGELVSVASYLETAVITQADDMVPSFDVNGTFSVPGIAIAHHRHMTSHLVPVVAEAWAFFDAIRKEDGFPLHIEVANSRIINARSGHRDITGDLLRFSNPSYELVLTEMAFGTNRGFSANEVDWSINSQLNEGPVGIHIAVGEGLTGAHIDLVCPGVELVPPAGAAL